MKVGGQMNEFTVMLSPGAGKTATFTKIILLRTIFNRSFLYFLNRISMKPK